MILFHLLAGCAPATCASACDAMVEGCDDGAFESVDACLVSCRTAEDASPSAPSTLGCYTDAGCDLEAVAACARAEERAGADR